MGVVKRFRLLLLAPVMLLSGCSFESRQLFIGVLVLVPFVLVIGVLWVLHRRPGDEEDWQEGRLPDSDDDDSEDHFLM